MFVVIVGYCNSCICIPLLRMTRIVFLSVFLILAVCHPADAAQSSSVPGVKAGFGLFTGVMEFLSVKTAALSGLSRSKPLTSPVEIYERNRLQNQKADFVK